ncbi:hypothetical protein [Croceicoccus sediminis]|uniref:hypothetical protein n=1 Tax=Croceicoccus sediminis TaxID=2571150 RepID=UPI0011838CE6|nr:hypothetical protein [Croceicoccus sediminis]
MRSRALLPFVIAFAVSACSEEPRDAQVAAPRQGMMDGMPADARGMRKVATFDADVLVLKRRNYGGLFGDKLSEYSPVDLAVAWSEGARAEVHSQIDIRQSGRFYYWRAGPDAWQDPRVRRFGKNSANWHLIPANEAIAERIDDIDENEIVGLKGYLVDIDGPDGGRWRTSRTRNDSGAGACEIILVTEVRAYDEAA